MSSNEPEPAEYQRKDMSQAPESPLGQQAAIEGALAAKGQPPNDEPRIWTLRDMKAMKNRSRLEATTALKTLYVQMLAEIENSEAERRAAVIAAGGDPDEDRDPLEFVHAIADEWAASDADAERRAELLDNLADRLDTREVRALRLAAEAAKAITPRLIAYDAAHGVSPAQIAEDLGVTESYVYRVLREQRAAAPPLAEGSTDPAEAPAGEYRLSTRAPIEHADWTERTTSGGHYWHRRTPSAGMRCKQCGLPYKDWSGDDCPAQ